MADHIHRQAVATCGDPVEHAGGVLLPPVADMAPGLADIAAQGAADAAIVEGHHLEPLAGQPGGEAAVVLAWRPGGGIDLDDGAGGGVRGEDGGGEGNAVAGGNVLVELEHGPWGAVVGRSGQLKWALLR